MLKYGKSSVKLTSLENEDSLPATFDEYVEGAEEGVEFFCGNGPQEVVVENGKILGLKLWKCLCIFDEKGGFNPEFDKECEQIIEGEQIFIAIGQAPDYDYIPESIKDKISINRGKIEASIDGQVKDVPWLFVGGDILRGPDLIGGVSDGHRSAKAIDAYLYENAKKQDISDSLKAMREAVKESSPELTIRQGGKK